MTRRGSHEVAFAVVELSDAHDRLRGIPLAKRQRGAVDEVLVLLSDVQARLVAQLPNEPGVPVAVASEYLGVSQPTVRAWIAGGILGQVDGAKPVLVDLVSLRLLGRALADLRGRGQDGDWTRALVDYLHDAGELRSEELRRGLDELTRGKLEPA